MSHEGIIYCKPHHRELFQPKVVVNDILDDKKDKKNKKTHEVISKFLISIFRLTITKIFYHESQPQMQNIYEQFGCYIQKKYLQGKKAKRL